MLREFLIILFAITGGFVVSGIVSSFYRLVTNQPGNFKVTAKSHAGKALSMGLIVLTGPTVLFQNAYTSRRKAGTPKGQFAIACAVVLFWSFLLGLFCLNMVILSGR